MGCYGFVFLEQVVVFVDDVVQSFVDFDVDFVFDFYVEIDVDWFVGSCQLYGGCVGYCQVVQQQDSEQSVEVYWGFFCMVYGVEVLCFCMCFCICW